MSIKEIEDFATKNGFNPKRYQDIQSLASEIAEKPWKNNKLSRNLLNLWEVNPEEVFSKKLSKETISSEILLNPNQFYELFDYQYYIKQRTLDILNSGVGLERMLIHMPTGTGKTKTAMHTLINHYNFDLKKQGLIIWIAPTVELLWQAYYTFCETWKHIGDGEITIYKLWNNHQCNEENLNGIIFCGIDKLRSAMTKNQELFAKIQQNCRLIIYDEAHQALATKTKPVIENLMIKRKEMPNRSLIGLTATPGRKAEASFENISLATMFGNRLINIDIDVITRLNMGMIEALNIKKETNIIRYFQNRRILSKIKPEQLEYTQNFTKKELKLLEKDLKRQYGEEKEFTKEQLNIFAYNKNRNLEIISRLKQLAKEKIPTIVFAISVEHAKMLSIILNQNNIKNVLITGDMKEDHKQAIFDFKSKENDINIIINYGVLTTGFDAKNIQYVFITRPTKSLILYSQMLGRGLRGPLMGGTEECLLIDVKDNLKNYDRESIFEYFNNYWFQ